MERSSARPSADFKHSKAGLSHVGARVHSFLARDDLHRLDPWDHLEWASALPVCAEVPLLPHFLEKGCDRVTRLTPAELHSARKSALAYWSERKRVTEPCWQRAFAQLPAHCQGVLGPRKNLFLLSEMLESISWPDATLISNLMHGFPLVGLLPASGMRVPTGNAAPEVTKAALLATASVQNRRILRRSSLPLGMDRSVCEVFASACDREVADGKARMRPLNMETCVLTPRFPIVQGWKTVGWETFPKVRCIDDFSASRINEGTQVSEKMLPETLDSLVALVLKLTKSRTMRIRWRKDDFVQAFKTLPICSSHLPLAVVVWQEALAKDQCLQLLAMPFGSSASVSAWERFGLAIQGVLAQIFLVLYLRFVDDLFSGDAMEEQIDVGGDPLTGPAGTAKLARYVISDLLGWDLDAAKAVTEQPSATILGVGVRFDDARQEIVFDVGPEKLELWSSQIVRALKAGALPPAEAQKLALRLSWGASSVFGKGARAPLAALFFHGAGRASRLTARTRLALTW